MTSSELDQLQRWEAAGGTWCLVNRGADGVTVALLTCSGGEEMARIHGAHSDLIAYVVRDRT